jgi:WD40 repeat protein
MAALSDGRLRVWDSDTGRELLALPWDFSAHKTAAFDPRGRYVAIGQANGTVEAFDLESGKKIGLARNHSASVTHLVVTDEAIVVSAATNGTIKAWNAALDQELYEIELRPAVSMSASRDGKCLSIAFQQPAAPEKQPNEVRVYNLHTGELIQSFRPDFVPHETGLNHDGSLVAAAARDGRLAVWDVASQQRRHSWTLPFFGRPVFAPDGRHLLTVNGNGTAYIFRLPRN